MITITLPDKSQRTFDKPVTGLEIAESIGKGLAKAALAVKVDGQEWDLSRIISHDAEFAVITASSPEGLELIRHDAAHVMASAVKELYPETQVTIGPAIENGFYYDFARPKPFTPEDLVVIEERMRQIVERDEKVVREEWDRTEAIRHFKSIGEKYKAEIIESIPGNEQITIYKHGAFLDLCRGPHLPSTGRLGKAFKLMKLAGAYWRGDSKNEMLQRIYGTAWPDQKALDAYLTRLEEAEKRDHRKLGKEMDLFHIQEEANGMIFWHQKGWTLYRTLQNYIRAKCERDGYIEVSTPQLMDRSLWEASGHWEKFRHAMFTAESEEKVLALKPMNCPGHTQIFKQGTKSYRDLPIRMMEFGGLHRNEPSGSLHGLLRVRGFAQDDAHIFCTEEQINSETVAFCSLLKEIYSDLGFKDVSVKFSDRPATRAGSDETWDRAEGALKKAVAEAGLEYVLNPGEGAFYGPKLEFVLRDAIGRDWQCGTLQVDFVLPERLDISYIGADGAKHRPVMLHRAILGSMERFIGVLIEEYSGKLPLWLAPVQAVIATITNEADDYAMKVAATLKNVGIRVETDFRNDKIGYKIREHSHAKVPVILALGKKEGQENSVSIRRIGSEKTESMSLAEATQLLEKEAGIPV